MPPATKNVPSVAIRGGVGEPDDDADGEAGEQCQRPGGSVGHEQAGDDRAECVDRSDGEVEAATD